MGCPISAIADPFKAIIFSASGTKKSIQVVHIALETLFPENETTLKITQGAIKSIQFYEVNKSTGGDDFEGLSMNILLLVLIHSDQYLFPVLESLTI